MELLPGVTASVKIETDSRSDALLAPNAALRWKPAGAVAKGPGVWVLGPDGAPRMIPSTRLGRRQRNGDYRYGTGRRDHRRQEAVIRTENLSRHFQLGRRSPRWRASLFNRCRRVCCNYRSSGSGKSTFMGIVGCLDKTDAREVLDRWGQVPILVRRFGYHKKSQNRFRLSKFQSARPAERPRKYRTPSDVRRSAPTDPPRDRRDGTAYRWSGRSQ